MITQGLSSHEISLITKILDEHSVSYHVDAAGGEEGVKVKGGRGDASFYQIEIPAEEFSKLPASAMSKLENHGIFPEMEAPDFSDEPLIKEKTPAEKERVQGNMKKFQLIFTILLAVMALSFVARVINHR